MTKKTTVGIVGCGHMGQYHVNVASSLSIADLVGIYDADPERAKQIADKHNTIPFENYEALLKEVESVVIAVPTFLHYEYAKKALENGKHVLLEKPIAESLEQAKEIVSLANSKNLTLQVGHVERFNGAVLELSKISKSPVFIESRRLAPYNPRIKDVGVVLDLMIHDIDIILNLVKSPVQSVVARGTKVVSDHEDIASVVIQFENGCVANLNASRATQAKIRTLTISEKDSYVYLDFSAQEIEIHRQASSLTQLSMGEIRYKQESIVEKIFVHKDNPLKQEHEHFFKCIQGTDTPLVVGDSDVKTLEVAHKILNQIGGHT